LDLCELSIKVAEISNMLLQKNGAHETFVC
jgi:hypothetical protein